ncbi:MAG: hypothetical protein ISQ14_15480 [Verrucomicrobiae bacterium]|nr:hypothetical protein [Verrucomicrobiae bacterium]
METVREHWEGIRILLRGDHVRIAEWCGHFETSRFVAWSLVAMIGSGLFGAAMGWWRAPEQAVYTGLKFPLVILLTMLGNGLLNGMLAPLLGVNIGFRQSFLAVMMSFTIAATILGALSPLLACLIWNTPPLEQGDQSRSSHAVILLALVTFVAFAGVVANVRLLLLLRFLSGSEQAARRVLFAWLGGNLLLGSQISWILRPFIGSPGLPVQFLRDEAMKGSFYEAVFHSVRTLLTE